MTDLDDKPPFTKKQGEYLAFILNYTEMFHCPPAEADIQQHFYSSPPTVHNMIVNLTQRGLIAREPGQARTIRVTLEPDHLAFLRLIEATYGWRKISNDMAPSPGLAEMGVVAPPPSNIRRRLNARGRAHLPARGHAHPLPTLQTERLVLRPFALSDAPEVQRLAGDWAIADTTLNIPHPYADGVAEEWIAGHRAAFDESKGLSLAITAKAGGTLLGAISLMAIVPDHQAKLGYWIGKAFWNQGYCTEAAREVMRYGFEELGLRRIHAWHIARNPASGRVMHKAGMRQEGFRPQHVQWRGNFEDQVLCGILKEDWESEAGQ